MSTYKTMFTYGVFCGAYNTTKSFYLNDDKKMEYGPITSNYKDFLMTMHKWYKEGLLDNNFMGADNKIVESSMLNGKAGATIGGAGGSIGKWMGMAPSPEYKVAGTKYPVLKKGDKPQFNSRQNKVTGYGGAITTKCQNVAAAVKVLDFAYSEKGHMLMNFGIEGESYKMENGYPKYTDLITKNPNGTSMASIMAMYMRSNAIGSFVQDRRYMEQFAALPEQKEALDVWSDSDVKNHMLPPFTPPAEDNTEYAKLMTEIGTYEDEMTAKFIMGEKSFGEWDSYVTKMKELGIERAMDILSKGLERYNNRK